MRKIFAVLSGSVIILLNSCINGQTQHTNSNLSANEFAEKIKEIPSAVIIDVRTPEEFAKGHLQHAANYNWNGKAFMDQITLLDKTKPVFIYCLSGGRSSAAAGKMRKEGFKQVYELDGGIMKWRAANLPETTSNTIASNGITKQQFDELLNSGKLVLIDFYADWCEPCKRMKPYLDEISKNMKDKVTFVRINADENKTICKELKIDALPVLQLYKNNSLIWTNTGFIEKAEVVKHLE